MNPVVYSSMVIISQLNPFIIYEKGIFSFIVLLNNIVAQLGLRRQQHPLLVVSITCSAEVFKSINQYKCV